MSSVPPQRANQATLPTDELQSNGSAGAAILSVGIGCCVLGILAVLADASKPFAGLLIWYRPTGPLSGVSSAAILVWLVCWLFLAKRWRTRTVRFARVVTAASVLLALGVLLTFPPFADLLLGR